MPRFGLDIFDPMNGMRHVRRVELLHKDPVDNGTGVAEEVETISLKVLPFDELMASVVDAKSIAALALYNGMPKSKI